MWKCKKCGYVVPEQSASIHVRDGYCPECKDFHLLERYDPLNEKKESPL